MTSESENEESKQNIPTLDQIRIQSEDTLYDMSAIVKMKPFPGDHQLLPLPDSEYIQIKQNPAIESFEQIQRQRILALMTENTLMLNNIIASQISCEDKIKASLEDLKNFKIELGEGSKSQIEKIEQIKEQKKCSGQFDSNPSASSLYKHFFNGPHVYRYELVLDCEIPTPIFRERNLVIKVKLIDTLTRQPV